MPSKLDLYGLLAGEAKNSVCQSRSSGVKPEDKGYFCKSSVTSKGLLIVEAAANGISLLSMQK